MSLPQSVSERSAYDLLSARERAFVDLFMLRDTPTEAMREAVPASKRPDELSRKWLKKPHIQQAIADRRQNILEAIGVRPEQIARRYKLAAFADTRELYGPDGALKPMHELTAEQAALIQELQVSEIFSDDDQADLFGVESKNPDEKRKGRSVIGYTRKFKRVPMQWGVDALRDLAGMDKGTDVSTIFNVQINF